jgi:predicted methyltransferase
MMPHKTTRPAMRFLARLTLAGSALAGSALGLDACATANSTVPTVSTEQAMADQRRPAEDVALDTQRRGDAVLELADIQPGWRVADIMQGAGYFTRLLVTKAGPSGKVYAWSPDEFMRTKPVLCGDSLDILSKAYPQEIVTLRSDFSDLAFPEPLDMVFTSQNYHDLHQRKSPPNWPTG